MALLCLILGLAAPSLARSIHQRNLTQEATRLLALTEYARDEAISRGVPMAVWIDTKEGRFGVSAMPGYEDAGARTKTFTLIDGLHFDPKAVVVDASGQTDAVEFEPDGSLDVSSQPSVRLLDRSDSGIEIDQMSDGTGYQIVKETP